MLGLAGQPDPNHFNTNTNTLLAGGGPQNFEYSKKKRMTTGLI